LSDEVRPPELRLHEDYYSSSGWTVVDVDSIDRSHAVESFGDKVRIDVDGEATRTSEVGDKGDRVNLSFWISQNELREILADAGVIE